MKHLILLVFVYVALATSFAKSIQTDHSLKAALKSRSEPEIITKLNGKERRSITNSKTVSQDHQINGKPTTLVTASSRKHGTTEHSSHGTSAEESHYHHGTQSSSMERNDRHSRKLGRHQHSRKRSRKNRFEQHLESDDEQKKGKNSDDDDVQDDSRYEKQQHHMHNKHAVTHALEHKKKAKPAPPTPTPNTRQGVNTIPGLGYSPYGAFPYNRLPFLPPVPVLYQPTTPQHAAPNAPVPAGVPNGGNSLFPVENIKMLEDTYSKFGNALRQLQNARNLNLNNAQHVTYIVPYVRRLEHLSAAMYNQLLGTLPSYDPTYRRQLANYLPTSYKPSLYYPFNYPPYYNEGTRLATRYYQPPRIQPQPLPMRYSMTKNELLQRLQSLLDRHPFGEQRIVLPVDVRRSQEANINPTNDRPRDIHYYVDPAPTRPRLEHVPIEDMNGPVEIHYHLPPQTADRRHTNTEDNDHYHVYLPQQKQAKAIKKIASNKVSLGLKGLLEQLAQGRMKQSNSQSQ